MRKSAFVSVPASSGNMGPGFDVLGIALDFRNETAVEVLNKAPGAPEIFVAGEGEAYVPKNRSNLVFQCLTEVFKRARVPVPKVRIHCLNRIPLARGLGSSSAAIVAGLFAGNRLAGDPFSRDELFALATQIEGHPDNVAPAIYGGVRASGIFDGSLLSQPWPSPRCVAVAAIPEFELSTKKARAVLPRKVPLADAIRNLAAVALMRRALETDLRLLGRLLNDQLHEPYRAKLIPGFARVKAASLKAGAYGTTLSGAGPTVLAYAPRAAATRVAKAMENAFRRAGQGCRALTFRFDLKGALVI